MNIREGASEFWDPKIYQDKLHKNRSADEEAPCPDQVTRRQGPPLDWELSWGTD